MTDEAPTADSPDLKARLKRQKQVMVKGEMEFTTAWRVGSGREGVTVSDLGVMLSPGGLPILPGSSLKGKLRSTCEALAEHFHLTACLLDSKATSIECTSDVKYYSDHLRKGYQKLIENSSTTLQQRLNWIEKHTCDVCKLFGSPLMSSRLLISEGRLQNPDAWRELVQVRDSVVIDRDSHTAVPRLKFDYEVIPAGTRFEIEIQLQNPSPAEEALIGAALLEWQDGTALGGFTSRGLGRAEFKNMTVDAVDLSRHDQLVKYLTRTAREEDRLTGEAAVEYWTTRIHDFFPSESK